MVLLFFKSENFGSKFNILYSSARVSGASPSFLGVARIFFPGAKKTTSRKIRLSLFQRYLIYMGVAWIKDPLVRLKILRECKSSWKATG